MKKLLTYSLRISVVIVFAGFLLQCSLDEITPTDPKSMENHEESHVGLNLKAGNVSNNFGVIDNFNDGVIGDIWNVSSTNNANIFESSGVLNIFIGEGSRPDGGNQVAGINSNQYFLTGDFDIQVDFQMCSDYHTIHEGNSKFIVVDQDGDLIEISIRTNHYETKELPAVGAANGHGYILTDHLIGKLRISRFGNTFTTYYWEEGWQLLGQWEATYVTGALKVDIDSWNWPPFFSEFSTQFDNLLISNGKIEICHKPGTPSQQTITVPAQALNGHLGHGDHIGPCQ